MSIWKSCKKIIKNEDKNLTSLIFDTIQYYWKNIPDKKYKNWLAVYSQKLKAPYYIKNSLPYMLQIEPTNMCNLNCPLCPTGRNELGRKRQHMKLIEFKSIIDDMEDFLLFLVLWEWGEPFLNPELPEMIQYASERGIQTVTSTNAHFLLDNDYVSRILKSGLTTLIVAIDSLKEDEYKKYRIGGSLDRAIMGLKNVIRLKRELKLNTLINLRMVINKFNEKELKSMKKSAKSLRVDRFTVKTINPSCGLDGLDEDFVPTNPKYRRYKYKKNVFEPIVISKPCVMLWYMCNIQSNGDVVPCSYDYSGELKFGNVYEKPLSEIWKSETTQNLRKKLYFEKDSILKCKECTINFKLSNSGWFPEYHDFNNTPIEKLFNKAKKYYYSFPIQKIMKMYRR